MVGLQYATKQFDCLGRRKSFLTSPETGLTTKAWKCRGVTVSGVLINQYLQNLNIAKNILFGIPIFVNGARGRTPLLRESK